MGMRMSMRSPFFQARVMQTYEPFRLSPMAGPPLMLML
jgi:hypothetical protein